MNTPSPLIPQGVTPARGKSSFFFKVLMILTVHVVVIGGMLLQGCKDTKDKDSTSNPPSDSTTTSTSDTMPPVTNPTAVSNSAQAPVSAIPAQPQALPPGGVAQQPPPVIQAPVQAPIQPVAAPVAAPTVPDTSVGRDWTLSPRAIRWAPLPTRTAFPSRR